MIRSKIAAGLVAAIAFQLLVLAGMVVNAALPLWTGTEVRVKTVPVDPRSLFRGNYARLAYEFGTLPEGALARTEDLRIGEVVYVSLEPGAGDVHEFAGASLDPPPEGIFLRGRLATNHPPYRVRYGLEAFFAPKEKALALEKDLRNGGIAILMVAGNGQSASRTSCRIRLSTARRTPTPTASSAPAGNQGGAPSAERSFRRGPHPQGRPRQRTCNGLSSARSSPPSCTPCGGTNGHSSLRRTGSSARK